MNQYHFPWKLNAPDTCRKTTIRGVWTRLGNRTFTLLGTNYSSKKSKKYN